MSLQAEPPTRMLKAVLKSELCVLLPLWTIHGLQKEVPKVVAETSEQPITLKLPGGIPVPRIIEQFFELSRTVREDHRGGARPQVWKDHRGTKDHG